jgi:hypothetical protein
MLRNIKDFMECTVGATDGHVGKIYDAYFDEEAWVVRYLAVDTALLTENRRVLIAARVVGEPQWDAHLMPVPLSKEQISKSPSAGSQFRKDDDSPLRSVNDVFSYHLHAADGDVGKISGFLIDRPAWAIRYMIVTTGHWWTGHDILIAPESIDEVLWGDSSVVVDLTRAAVRGSPAFDESSGLTAFRS